MVSAPRDAAPGHEWPLRRLHLTLCVSSTGSKGPRLPAVGSGRAEAAEPARCCGAACCSEPSLTNAAAARMSA